MPQPVNAELALGGTCLLGASQPVELRLSGDVGHAAAVFGVALPAHTSAAEAACGSTGGGGEAPDASAAAPSAGGAGSPKIDRAGADAEEASGGSPKESGKGAGAAAGGRGGRERSPKRGAALAAPRAGGGAASPGGGEGGADEAVEGECADADEEAPASPSSVSASPSAGGGDASPASGGDAPAAKRTGPSVNMRVCPSNLAEAKHKFFASDCQEAPVFRYNYLDEEIDAYFAETSHVCYECLPDAERILKLMYADYGSPKRFSEQLYGPGTLDSDDLFDAIQAYVDDLNLMERVNICIVEQLLSIACVNKFSNESKFQIKIRSGALSGATVQSICDHEVGTHLLRMVNDESQTWHRNRDRYGLSNPWTTEEGLATLNTYISLPSKLLYPQALMYFAVCRGSSIGFVELFQELRSHFADPERCWTMCCRVKRGLRDTSKPGASYVGQAYFKGCVEILQNLNGLDFSLLYSGQIALQDLKRANRLIRRDNVRLPRFLSNERRYKIYWEHCLELLRVNGLDKPAQVVARPLALSAGRKIDTRRAKSSDAGLRRSSSCGAGLNRTTDASGFAATGRPAAPSSSLAKTTIGFGRSSTTVAAPAAASSTAPAGRSARSTSAPGSKPRVAPTAASARGARSSSAAASSPAPRAKRGAKSPGRKAKAKAGKDSAKAAAKAADTPPSPQPLFRRPSVGSWVVYSFADDLSKPPATDGAAPGPAAAAAGESPSPVLPPPLPPPGGERILRHKSKCRIVALVQDLRIAAVQEAGEASMCDCCGL